jgi:hypothetical protein
MFLYLTLYLQDVLGLSPLAAGLRFIVLSSVILVVAAISGRLTTVVPVRLLMGAGLILAGVSLILMRGVTVHSGWTHLLPGFIVGGFGVGMINPPLASTAIAVVPPRQAGMGSGINSTFRQLGIATGIAALGSIFTSEIRTHVVAGLRAAHQGGASALSAAINNDNTAQVIGKLPPTARAAAGEVARASFISSLNDIFLVAAIVAFVGGVGALVLIRSRDFVAQGGGENAAAHAEPAGQVEMVGA